MAPRVLGRSRLSSSGGWMLMTLSTLRGSGHLRWPIGVTDGSDNFHRENSYSGLRLGFRVGFEVGRLASAVSAPVS